MAGWAPEELERLAVLLRRLVDDFVAHAEALLDFAVRVPDVSPA